MLYRVLTRLHMPKGNYLEKGDLVSMSRLKSSTIKMLLERECISVVHAPPLSIVPGMEEISDALDAEGIIGADHLIEADLAELEKATGIPEDELKEHADRLYNYMRG